MLLPTIFYFFDLQVNPGYIEAFETQGMKFVGRSVDGERMEILELEGHPYFVAVQYHPEYISRPMKPSAPYLGLVLASINRLNSYIARGCRLSPRNSFSDTESSDTEEEMASLMSKSLSFTSHESSPQQL